MLESLSLANVASYGPTPERLQGLSKFNYLFGANGSGKTTVGRVIADETAHPSCACSWARGMKLEVLAYNRDFVERNSGSAGHLRGVFTLGEANVNLLAKIESLKGECDGHTRQVATLTEKLQGVDGFRGVKQDLRDSEARFESKCWDQKIKHDTLFQSAFKGLRNNKIAFKARVLQEANTNASQLLSFAELEKKAESIFASDPASEKLLGTFDVTKLVDYETDPILSKRIIGKEDVDIAAMVKKLGNSDWVRQGRSFFEANDGTCPFCQQKTQGSFQKSLAEYFDETFETDSRAANALFAEYTAESRRLITVLGAIVEMPSRFLDLEKLKAEKAAFERIAKTNEERLTSKRREPSQVVELETSSVVAALIVQLIGEANTKVAAHNTMVENIARERMTLVGQVWKFLIETELKSDLEAFKSECDGVQKAINGLTAKIKAENESLASKQREIRLLEKQTTSTQPTVDAINAILKSFGFTGFSLAPAEDGATYRLIRANGTDAKTTLSEGERTFVTFLYFFHLLNGSQSESGVTANRLVIFDDPVSSLDSDVLFIVSSLIKGVLDDVRNDRGNVKQVFVLTHNVFFHREVTFNPKRRNDTAMSEESFFIVRKESDLSKIVKHDSNPIKTSYELLWTEVRDPHGNSLTIQNTLRRILENYFKILGGIDPDEICAHFSGQEKLICKSLFSWVNAGSHFANDDLYVPVEGGGITTYFSVFRAIFEKTNQLAHYEMMMRETCAQVPPRVTAIVPSATETASVVGI